MDKVIKMKKEFFELIKEDKKRFEFRKLEKGLTGGVYKVVDVDDTKKILGRITMIAVTVNPSIGFSNNKYYWVHPRGQGVGFDKKSFEFVKENYTTKFIDYVVYEVKYLSEPVIRKENNGN